MTSARPDLLAEIAHLRERAEAAEAEVAYLKEQADPPAELFVAVKHLGLARWVIPALQMFLTHTVVSSERLDGLGGNGWDSPTNNYAKTAVSRIRCHFRRDGIEFTNIWGWGYSITDDHQQKLQKLVDSAVKSVNSVDNRGHAEPERPIIQP